jgi:hypothetical protein
MDHDALGEAAGSGPRKRAATKCFTCGGEGHMARDCTSTRCHYCGRQGHIAKTCPMGQAGCKHPDQLFVFCDKLDDVSQPPGRTSSLAPLAPPLQDCGSDAQGTTNSATAADSNCFVRRFVVPLSRARPDFTLSDLVDGRLDVACRYASYGIILLCVPCSCGIILCTALHTRPTVNDASPSRVNESRCVSSALMRSQGVRAK